MRQVVIDNNSIDRLIDDAEAYEVVKAAIDRGDLAIRYVHTTQEEAARTPNLEKRSRLLRALTDIGELYRVTASSSMSLA